MNKRAYSTGFTWVFGLVTIFGLGLLYITFDQVLTAHLVPVVKNMVNGSYGALFPIDAATQTQINNDIDKYMTFFHIMPYVLFLVVVIYMIVAAIRKEGESF